MGGTSYSLFHFTSGYRTPYYATTFMSNSARRQEIEAKRARLAALREQRLERAEPPIPEASSPSSSRKNIDQFVDSLLNRRAPSTEPPSPSPDRSQPPSEPASQASSRVASQSDQSGQVGQAGQVDANTVVISSVFDVAPKTQAVETYSKEVQTDPISTYATTSSQTGNDIDYEQTRKQLEQQIRDELASTSQATTTTTDSANTLEPERQKDESLKPAVINASQAEDLQKFLNSSFRVINRAMEEDYDILVDYSAASQESRNQVKEGDDTKVTQLCQFYSEASSGRAITGLDWSSLHPELVASCHTGKQSDVLAPKGLVQIWNSHYKGHNSKSVPAEYCLNAPSDILNVRFSPFDAHMVFGSAYNGQLFAWDLRTGSSIPILQSPLTGAGHSFPVYSLQISGTQNAHNLVSASTDGTVCTWTSDLLAKPQHRLQLGSGAQFRHDEVSPTSLSVFPRDSTRFLVGSEMGMIYQCNWFDRAGSKAGLDPSVNYRGHQAPVTAVDFHSYKGAVDLGDYFLTSSLDWSIKLWKVDKPATSSPAVDQARSVEPVLDLRRDVTVYDVAWSPDHPAVFADVDGSGYLDIWNLNLDVEFPLARIKPTGSDSYLSRPLNKLAWSKPNGSRIAVGGLDGVVTVFDVSLKHADNDDWSKFKRTLSNVDF